MKATLKLLLCVIVMLASSASSAKELGRLFFTPEQRAQLDYRFAREMRPQYGNQGMVLNGIVQKHGGKRTAWINGVPQTAGNSDEKAPESMPVTLPGQTKPVKVKVGQRIQLNPSVSAEKAKPAQDAPGQ